MAVRSGRQQPSPALQRPLTAARHQVNRHRPPPPPSILCPLTERHCVPSIASAAPASGCLVASPQMPTPLELSPGQKNKNAIFLLDREKTGGPPSLLSPAHARAHLPSLEPSLTPSQPLYPPPNGSNPVAFWGVVGVFVPCWEICHVLSLLVS